MKRAPTAQRVVTTSFLVDVSDVVINVTVALISGSVVILAEALQGLSDLISSSLLLVGLKNSKRPADGVFPFGQGKAVYFWSLLSAIVMLTLSASFSIYFGIQRTLNPQPVESISLAFLVLGFALISNSYSCAQGWRRINASNGGKSFLGYFFSSPMALTKNTIVRDFMGASAAGLGLLALGLYQYTGEYRFDGLGAIGVGIVLAIMAIILIVGVKDYLIGRSASAETEEKIRVLARTVPGVVEVLDLSTMQLGPEQTLVNLEVNLRNNLDTDEIEMIMDKIKAKIQSELPQVSHIQVEPESPDIKQPQAFKPFKSA
jgi:cation diffusion facilitator family transporter